MPELVSETKIKVFLIPSNDPVTAMVTIGEAQPGGWSMYLGGVLLKKGTEPSEVALGNGDAVKGKQLLVDSIVMDRRDETNRVSVTVRVACGAQVAQEAHARELQTGGSAHFTTIFVLG